MAKKRKQIVNYRIKEYSESHYVANLIIGKTHPFFTHNIYNDDKIIGWVREKVPDTLEVDWFKANSNWNKTVIIKSKFRNLNFINFIVLENVWPRVFSSLTEFKEEIMKLRWRMMEIWIEEIRRKRD